MVHSATPRMRNAILLSLFALVIIGASTLGPYWFLKSEVKRMDFRNDILSIHLSELQDRQELLESRIAKLEHDSVIPPAIKTNWVITIPNVTNTNRTIIIGLNTNQITPRSAFNLATNIAVTTSRLPLPPSPSQRQSVTHR